MAANLTPTSQGQLFCGRGIIPTRAHQPYHNISGAATVCPRHYSRGLHPIPIHWNSYLMAAALFARPPTPPKHNGDSFIAAAAFIRVPTNPTQHHGGSYLVAAALRACSPTLPHHPGAAPLLPRHYLRACQPYSNSPGAAVLWPRLSFACPPTPMIMISLEFNAMRHFSTTINRWRTLPKRGSTFTTRWAQ